METDVLRFKLEKAFMGLWDLNLTLDKEPAVGTAVIGDAPQPLGPFHAGTIQRWMPEGDYLEASFAMTMCSLKMGDLNTTEVRFDVEVDLSQPAAPGRWRSDEQVKQSQGVMIVEHTEPPPSPQKSRIQLTFRDIWTTLRKDFRDAWVVIDIPAEQGRAHTFHQHLQGTIPFDVSGVHVTGDRINGVIELAYPGDEPMEVPAQQMRIEFDGMIVRDRIHGQYRASGDMTAEFGQLSGLVLKPIRLQERAFSHPGLLNDADELQQFTQQVHAGREPWVTGWQRLQDRADRFLAHTPKPVEHYCFIHHSQPGHTRDLKDNLEAAYGNTLLWAVGGNPAHADAAIRILDAWSTIFKSIELSPPDKTHYLSICYLWPTAVWAAELLRSYGGWPEASRKRFSSMLRELVLPIASTDLITNNWRSWAICCQMTLGIYLDDGAVFEEAIRRYRLHVDFYLLHADGQTRETTRDLNHAQMGLAPMLATCEMAYKQGVDLYSLRDNRLFTAVCYHIPFILGDTEGWPSDVVPPRETGVIWPMYELAAYHYQGRIGLTDLRLDRMRAEQFPEGFNRIGWGTLTHAVPPVA